MSKREDLLRKLKALSERGEGGEAINASAKLQQLMRKYGISEDDLDDAAKEYRDFKYCGHFEHMLLQQIIYMVTGNVDFYGRKSENGKTVPNVTVVYCTNAEQIEIQAAFEFYKYHLNIGMENYYRAFIEKENIFPEEAKADPSVPQMKSDEDLQRLYHAIDKHDLHPKLEDGK